MAAGQQRAKVDRRSGTSKREREEGMPAGDLESQIARLRREIERLSARHTERMRRQTPSAGGTETKLEVKRAEILARRIRQLNEMLDSLRCRKSH